MKKYLVIFSLFVLAACSKSNTDIITPPPPPATPTVNFTYAVVADQYPVTVNFTNTSTGYTSYSWNLGNGTSTIASPTGSYNSSGIKYTIKLVASNGTKTDSISADIIIPSLNKSVCMYYIIPNDKTFSQAYYDAIANNANTVRLWYNTQLGKTYKLNNPVVNVVYATIPSATFLNLAGPTGVDPSSYFLYHSLAVLKNAGLRDPANDGNYIYNVFTPVANPLGYGIWGSTRAAGIPDFGLAQLSSANTATQNLGMGLWSHELGHSFGLSHPVVADPANIMTSPGGINVWPVTGVIATDKTIALANGFMF